MKWHGPKNERWDHDDKWSGKCHGIKLEIVHIGNKLSLHKGDFYFVADLGECKTYSSPQEDLYYKDFDSCATAAEAWADQKKEVGK